MPALERAHTAHHLQSTLTTRRNKPPWNTIRIAGWGFMAGLSFSILKLFLPGEEGRLLDEMRRIFSPILAKPRLPASSCSAR
jgi:hypothetical protein